MLNLISDDGFEVVMEAVDKPRSIEYKEIGSGNLITETDKNSEEKILSIIKKEFPDHAILGEEGGTIGTLFFNYLNFKFFKKEIHHLVIYGVWILWMVRLILPMDILHFQYQWQY